ncbi:MAG: Rpn family recombination-promoting nuclease/putative transposase, partial [Myxococcota bacterium]
DGRDALVFVLVEHQSGQDASMAYRMFRYVSRIWEVWLNEHPESGPLKLPLVLPIVLYHGTRAWRAPLNVQDLIESSRAKDGLGELLISAPYVVFDTSGWGDEALAELAVSQVCRLTLLALANVKRPVRFATKLRAWLGLLATVVREPEGRRLVELILRYYDQVRGPEEFTEAMAVARELDAELEKAMYTAADMLRDEGRDEERRAMLRRQLEIKFGSLSADVVERLRAASSAELHSWVERIVSVDSLDALLNTNGQ